MRLYPLAIIIAGHTGCAIWLFQLLFRCTSTCLAVQPLPVSTFSETDEAGAVLDDGEAASYTTMWCWIRLAFGIVISYVCALCSIDCVSWWVHWTLDNWLEPTTPLIGKMIANFRLHHSQPRLMLQKPYYLGNYDAGQLAVALILLRATVVSSDIHPVADATFGLFCLFGMYIIFLHNWSHYAEKDTPQVLLVFRALGFGLPIEYHKRHHQYPSSHYSSFNSWYDRFVFGYYIGKLTEMLLYVFAGIVGKESTLQRLPPPETLTRRRERFRQWFWFSFYEWVSAVGNGVPFYCMNWGFAQADPDSTPAEDILQPTFPFASSQPPQYRLYHYMCSLLPKHAMKPETQLLEISSGRGGGLCYLSHVFNLKSVVGVDWTLNNLNVAKTVATASDRQVKWVHSGYKDLMAQGLQPASFDVILNVEASHCYDDFDAFLDIALSLLRPGGHLLWTDFRPKDQMRALLALIHRRVDLGKFETVRDEDISRNVMAGMTASRDHNMKFIQYAPKVFHPVLIWFAASSESAASFRQFAEHRSEYRAICLRKL